MSTAVNVFLRKAIEVGGFPFDVRYNRPNPEVVMTIFETEKGINAKTFKNLNDLWEDLNV